MKTPTLDRDTIMGTLTHMAQELTATDMFCGAGGSSTGALEVPGVTVKTAMNHWARSVTNPRNHAEMWDNRNSPGGACNTSRGLTHSLVLARKGLPLWYPKAHPKQQSVQCPRPAGSASKVFPSLTSRPVRTPMMAGATNASRAWSSARQAATAENTIWPTAPKMPKRSPSSAATIPLSVPLDTTASTETVTSNQSRPTNSATAKRTGTRKPSAGTHAEQSTRSRPKIEITCASSSMTLASTVAGPAAPWSTSFRSLPAATTNGATSRALANRATARRTTSLYSIFCSTASPRKQAGNAVTPPAARDLFIVAALSLAGGGWGVTTPNRGKR